MKKAVFTAVLGAVLLLAPQGLAQDEAANEIVVTGARYRERYEDTQMPQVAIVRRADFIVAHMYVESDTRDLAQRNEELMETLRELGRRARSAGAVTVALLEEGQSGDAGETRVKPFTVEAAREQITSGSRADTSGVSVLLRTRVTAEDTLATAEGRIDAFARGLPKPGRVTWALGTPDLTVLNPGQYRGAIIDAIAADARSVVAAVGAGQAVRIEGLEARVAWRRSGDLTLTFYIPHRLAIVPAGQAQ